ncbi:MAG: aspartate aminotransferase family protein [Deltaproteobacteria bacterium]|nr:aspartate aminotransferase family protein [Deltaproteobacteria bacterium]MBW2595157.1 aspartate aminotransferase family protein [Deltaproteobacteria bacterium]MBW2649592.1 aspartate aminotransferase family protein [Deltaproteobacteria bacterium]
MKSIPEKGIPREEVLDRLKDFAGEDVNYRDNKIFSLVYYLGEEHTDFLKQAYGMYFSENALNPMAFRSLKRFEHEVVRMSASLLNGDDQVAGVMTSGGTESCLLPVLAYREMARASRVIPLRRPEMIAPETIHVAWEKAAKYFGVKMVHVPIDSDCRVDVDSVRKKINRNTIMIVASAPSYPHGVIDPITHLGEIALSRGIPFHVDSCLGGFLLPFVERLGYEVPPFDFRVPGVTSISADVHKYAFSAKGASTLLYRNIDYLKHQFFICTDWPGGIFASPALLGTRPGGAIAAAWAALNTIGMDGYLDIARTIMDTTDKFKAGIEAIDGLKILGEPAMGVFAYTSEDRDVNIFAVGDQLEEKGWLVDRLQRPDALHCMITPRHAAIADQYLADLQSGVEAVRRNPELATSGNAAMYGMIAHVPFRALVKKEVAKMMNELYGSQCIMPPLSTGSDQESGPRAVKLLSAGLNALNRLRK